MHTDDVTVKKDLELLIVTKVTIGSVVLEGWHGCGLESRPGCRHRCGARGMENVGVVRRCGMGVVFSTLPYRSHSLSRNMSG